MDAPLRRHHRNAERWSEWLPGAYFTRIVLPIGFVHSMPSLGSRLHVIGRDRRGDACYCHFVCEFSSPRCFRSGRRQRGEPPLLVSRRELRAWRLHGDKWFVCIVDRIHDSNHEQLRYSTQPTMPESVCLDDDAD